MSNYSKQSELTECRVSDEKPDSSSVRHQLGLLEEQLLVNTELQQTLFKRIEPILYSESCIKETENSEKERELSEISSYVRKLRYMTESNNRELDRIIGEVKL